MDNANKLLAEAGVGKMPSGMKVGPELDALKRKLGMRVKDDDNG